MIYVLIPSTPERKVRLAEAIRSVKKSICNQPIQIRVDINNYEGYVKSVLRLLDKIDGLAFLMGNDVEVEPDTLQKLHDVYTKTFPNNDGLCAPVDLSIGVDQSHQVFSHPFAHSSTFRDIIFPGYFHNFVDREWTDIMRKRNKFAIVETSFIKHNHYLHDNIELKDRTYEVGESSSHQDGQLYYQRRANEFKS